MTSFLPTLFFHRTTREKYANFQKKDSEIFVPKKHIGKKYILMPDCVLPKIAQGTFLNFLDKRSSSPARDGSTPLTIDNLSYLLMCGYGERRTKDGNKNSTPSAGGLYPLEIYVLVLDSIETMQAGIYHYNKSSHILETVQHRSFSKEDIMHITPYDWVANKSIILIFTAFFESVLQKYGNRGYRYIFLEAGHAAQNMLVAGLEHNVYGVPLGGVDDEYIEKCLGLNSSEEVTVYAITF